MRGSWWGVSRWYCAAAYCLLPTAYCLLPTAYCLLPTAYCLLPPLVKAPRRHRGLDQQFLFANVFSGYPVLVSSSIHPIVIKAV
ncbi:hypothetical protein CPU03_15420 [Edwardsiella tarda]|nr:hypothetical protein CPU03_15420 [Edwardsiella tarda]